MKNFKLKTGNSPIYHIEKNTFEKLTFQSSPYYGTNNKGDKVCFAVCPQCDNPIEIIGLYKKMKHTTLPYGKHYPHRIDGLTEYNQQAFEYCPYAAKNRNISPKSRKTKLGAFEKRIYYTVREQFDRIIYLLEREIDMKFSLKYAENLLQKYIDVEGWLYSWATLNNIPWVLGHLTMVKPMFGQLIRKGSPLYSALKENCSNAELLPTKYEKYERLSNKDGKWLNVEYCIISHHRDVCDGEINETMDFCVRETNYERNYKKQFYHKILTIDECHFMNLLSMPDEKSHRNHKLLEISKRVMPDL